MRALQIWQHAHSRIVIPHPLLLTINNSYHEAVQIGVLVEIPTMGKS